MAAPERKNGLLQIWRAKNLQFMLYTHFPNKNLRHLFISYQVTLQLQNLKRKKTTAPTNKPKIYTLPDADIAPENWCLQDYIPFGKAYFQGRAVSFREG